MKSGNKIYVILAVAIISVLTFFFTTKLWCPDDRKKQDNNYNQLVTLGEWDLRFGNASYDNSTKTLSCLVYKKTGSQSPKSFDMKCYLGKSSLNKGLHYELKKAKDQPNFAMLYIHNVPSNYYFVTIALTADEIIGESSSSEGKSSQNSSIYQFKSESDSSTSLPKKVTKEVKIDYRIANSSSSSLVNSSSSGE